MTVHAEFFSHLRDIVGGSKLDLDLPDEATIDDLVRELCRRYPRMNDFKNSILVGLGVEFVERFHVLRAGDEIAVMPPVQGG